MPVDFGQIAEDYGQHRAWRGRIRASAGVAASLPPEQVSQFDAGLGRLLRQQFPDDPLEVPHRVFAVICRVK